MFAIITTRWHTRPLSRRPKPRSSAPPVSLRKKYAGIAYPPNMVHSTNHSTTSGDHRKPVLVGYTSITHRQYRRAGTAAACQKGPLLHLINRGALDRLKGRPSAGVQKLVTPYWTST